MATRTRAFTKGCFVARPQPGIVSAEKRTAIKLYPPKKVKQFAALFKKKLILILQGPSRSTGVRASIVPGGAQASTSQGL